MTARGRGSRSDRGERLSMVPLSQSGHVRFRSGSVGQLLSHPEAVRTCCGDFVGKVGNVILAIITYINKRKRKH